jgi:uncharacterized protein (DUF1810 family)
MPSSTPLERFHRAQNAAHGGFSDALAEIRRGAKRGHWIWYVFPQLDGLGSSPLAREFALQGPAEAGAYLRDRELRARLLTTTTAAAEQMRSGRSVDALMGSDIDAKKLVSSLTLFAHVAGALAEHESDPEYAALAREASEVLAIAEAQGYPRCAYTRRRLAAGASDGIRR